MKIKKYGASWCGACKTQDREFKNHPLNVNHESIDIDDLEEEVLDALHIKSIPIIVAEDNEGNEIKRWVNFTSSAEINSFLDSTK